MSLSIHKKLCDLGRDLKQTAFVLLNQKFSLVDYVITGQRNTFATRKNSKIISLFHCRVVSSLLCVLENQCFQRIPIFQPNKLQFVNQVTRKTFSWSIKAPYKPDNLDQQISLDADGDDSYRLTLYPFKARNPDRTFTPD